MAYWKNRKSTAVDASDILARKEDVNGEYGSA